MVLFPEPEGPTMAVTLPAGMRKLRSSRTFTSGRLGYIKLTFSNTISPSIEMSGDLHVLYVVLGESMMVWKIAHASAAWEAAATGALI